MATKSKRKQPRRGGKARPPASKPVESVLDNAEAVDDDDEDAVVADAEAVADDADAVVHEADVVVADDESVADDEAVVSDDEAEVAGDEEEVAGDEEEVAGDEAEVAGDEEEVAGDDEAVAGDEEAVASDDEVAADDDEAPLVEDEIEGATLPTTAAAMSDPELKGLIEALIFASDKPLTLQRIRQLTRVSDTGRLNRLLKEIAVDLEGRGLVLQQVSGGYQFRTATVYSAWVQQLIAGRPVRLSRAQLETLAIIAYRQPITRPEIDEIRGVDSGGTLKVLLDRGLIRTLGKREEVGRPILYGTTREFLDFFSLGDLRELPTLREYAELTPESRDVMKRLGVEAPDDGAVAAAVADGQAGAVNTEDSADEAATKTEVTDANTAEDLASADEERVDGDASDDVTDVADAEVTDAEVTDAEVTDAEVTDDEIADDDAEVTDDEVTDDEIADDEIADDEIADDDGSQHQTAGDLAAAVAATLGDHDELESPFVVGVRTNTHTNSDSDSDAAADQRVVFDEEIGGALVDEFGPLVLPPELASEPADNAYSDAENSDVDTGVPADPFDDGTDRFE